MYRRLAALGDSVASIAIESNNAVLSFENTTVMRHGAGKLAVDGQVIDSVHCEDEGGAKR